MRTESIQLWKDCPEVRLDVWVPDHPKTDASVLILPGGGYTHLADHEGSAYARWFNELGMTAFVCAYRLAPEHFPAQLLDSRRAMRWIRAHAERYSLNPERVLIMGSSAGGHLAALTATYTQALPGEDQDDLAALSPVPDAQILCYPVIYLVSRRLGAHTGSARNLLGDAVLELGEALTPVYLVTEHTPPCFLFHTAEDASVPVRGSLDYVHALAGHGVDVEMHVFPHGRHGLGMCSENTPAARHAGQWTGLLRAWLTYHDFLPGTQARE